MRAAREVFIAQGFSNASIADIVDQADSSVGSLYHHFGGKTELFLALWYEQLLMFAEISRKEVRSARQRGVDDPVELFLIATRAQLMASWQNRDLAMVFRGDVPSEFERIKHQSSVVWLFKNDALLELSDGKYERLYASSIWGLVNESSLEVLTSKTRGEAAFLIEGIIDYVRRILAQGPWKPSAVMAEEAAAGPAEA